MKTTKEIYFKLLAEALVLGLFLMLFLFGPFYNHFLHKYTKFALIGMYGFYVAFYLPYILIYKRETYFKTFESGKFLISWYNIAF